MGVAQYTHGMGLTTFFAARVRNYHHLRPFRPSRAPPSLERQANSRRFTPVLPLRTILRRTGRLTDILDQYDHHLRHESTNIVLIIPTWAIIVSMHGHENA